MPSILAIADDNTPSTRPYRKVGNAGRQKAHDCFARDNSSAAVSIYVIEQMCGFPLGNTGFIRADKAFTQSIPEGDGSPLGNALHQQTDAIEHFIRSAAKLGSPVHAVVFAPARDWQVNCEPSAVIESAAQRVKALAQKVGKKLFVQPVVVGDHANVAVAELFAFQRAAPRLEEVDLGKFLLWLCELSRRASVRGDEFTPPNTDFLRPAK